MKVVMNLAMPPALTVVTAIVHIFQNAGKDAMTIQTQVSVWIAPTLHPAEESPKNYDGLLGLGAGG